MAAWNPAVPSVFATVAGSEHLHLWDTERRQQLKKARASTDKHQMRTPY